MVNRIGKLLLELAFPKTAFFHFAIILCFEATRCCINFKSKFKLQRLKQQWVNFIIQLCGTEF